MSFVAVPGTSIGDYVVVSEIGRGGMAVVYLAEHPGLGRKVALKLLAPALADDQGFRERFMREARLAAGIEHPNIIPVHDAGEIEGLLYIAMRYVDGIDLEKLLQREERLPLERSIQILDQVAAGLDAAHAKGLVHRDVKPSNVLIAPGEGPGGTDHAYLADFGLARPQLGVSSHTQVGELYGTVDYMAPEQLDGRPTDARTDVYALSCLAYECLTGEPPFHRDTVIATASAHLHDDPVPPSVRTPGLPTGVDEAILRGLSKDKASRPPSAGALLEGLIENHRQAADVTTRSVEQTKPGARTAVEERKVVTVLAAAIDPEAPDPEDHRMALERLTPLVQAEIRRFGGSLQSVGAGAIVGVFGVPLAHEDDAERAGLAALQIMERVAALGAEKQATVRIGISTGEALIAFDPERPDEASSAGLVMQEALELRTQAGPGFIFCSGPTHRLTERTFSYEALDGPEPSFRLVSARARLGVDLASRMAPFVGRDFELGSLVRLFNRSQTTPSVEFVTIVADPGLGKTRLVRELAVAVHDLPEFVTWRVGKCLPYGEGISVWALGEIVKSHTGILETDDQATLSSKLDRALREPDEGLRSWMKDRLAPLVGLQTGTEPPQQQEAFTAWRRFLEQIAQTGPTVLVVEDLHWADDVFIAFMQHLAEHSTGLPLLIVTTARPEIEERHPSWLGRSRRSTVLSLAALAKDDMHILVESLLEGASPELVATVLERAGGSPLYAEQLAAMFKDQQMPVAGGSLERLAIPPTIQALIAARIDALPGELKAALLDASVVGRTFWSGAVVALSDRDHAALEPALTELTRREFIRRVVPSTMEDDSEFTFWHELVRDVAYAELPRAARMTKHRATAAWITDRVGSSLGEDAEIVVEHYTRALDLAEALGAVEDVPELHRGLTGALLAAAESATHTDAARAVAHLRRALGSLDPDDPRRADALARLGRVLIAVGDHPEAAQMLEEAADAYRSRGDELAAAQLASQLSVALPHVGEAQRARAIMAAARTALEEDPGPGLVSVISAEAQDAMAESRFTHAIALSDRAIELSESLGLPSPHRALAVRGGIRLLRDEQGGEADMRRAIDRAVADGDLRSAASGYYNLAASRSLLSSAAGLADWDEAISFAAAHGLPTELMRSGRAETLFPAGEWDELLLEAGAVRAWAAQHGDAWSGLVADSVSAAVRLERGESIGPQEKLLAQARDVGMAPTYAAHIAAEAALAEGDASAGRRLLGDALDATNAAELIGPARFVRACLRTGAPDLARRAIELGTPAGAEELVEIAAAEAMLAEADGDHTKAQEIYQRVAGSFLRFGNLPEQAYAVAGLGRSLLALGETEPGIARLRESRAIWERLKAKPRIAEIDEIFGSLG